MTTPETPKTPETPEVKHELKELKLNVSKNYEKFETLSKNPSLKKWLEKIMKKSLEWKIKNFAESYNKYSKRSVDEYTYDMIKKHPDLISFIRWELNLPIKIWESSNKVKFFQLSFEQKLKFMALTNVYWDNVQNYNNIKSSKIIDDYRKYMNSFIKETTENFNGKIESKKNIIWLVDLEKVLKEEYWLTDPEYKKMKEYITLIQDHPEYVWWIMKPQEAWFGAGLLVGIIIGLVIWGLGYYAYQNMFKIKAPETRVYGDHTEIENFEETFKIISAVALTDSHERLFHEDGFGHVDLWWTYLKPAEWFINWAADILNRTGLENRDMSMRIKCKNYYTFDFKWAKCSLQKENWERTVYLKWVKKPEVISDVIDVEILDSKKELISLKKFDKFEINAQNVLKEEAKKEALKLNEIEKANESLGKQLLWVFQSLWCHNSDVDVEWKDIKRIVIQYEEDQRTKQISVPVDPENKKTLKN